MTIPSEKLGSFYLGEEYDIEHSRRLNIPLHYDARDLTTHAICVGMTGSGKTGLCIGLLEEAALDRIPTIMIDPKGDITNLLLQFPDMKPENFRPWINIDDARRKNMSVDDYAAATAEKWKTGLADWGIGPERIRSLGDSADYTIYTPGSDAGLQVSILGSLAAPKLDFESNREMIGDRISGTVSALLGLAGLKVDPLRSREAILLAGIFEHFWKLGEDMDLARLILSIQDPPLQQVGVFNVDTFFPREERFELAMAFNNLMASPGFQSWLEGDPLDIDQMLFAADGKPRHSIFYLAHLPDSERMFFVTLILENMLSWMRQQAGTTSLRALLYFDEVFGFLPPVAEPPSKRPLMTMLKQARAFGVGCILVTQNPVDIDYKGLTNAGTWFIGKLQAERDKERVLDGLKNAINEAGGSHAAIDYDSLIAKLGSRVFLMHNVHEDNPVVFHTRWAMSYLRGPLTRPQVKQLMQNKKTPASSPPGKPAPPIILEKQAETVLPVANKQTQAPPGYLSSQPLLDPAISQKFLPLGLTSREALVSFGKPAGHAGGIQEATLLYKPALFGLADVHFVDKKKRINEKVEKKLFLNLSGDGTQPDWQNAEALPVDHNRLLGEPEKPEDACGPFFAPVQQNVSSKRKITSISKQLADWLYYNERKNIAVHDALQLFQRADESLRNFTIRLQQAAREKRDREIDALEEKFEKQLERLEKRLRREKRELAEDELEHENRKRQELFSIGETVIGFFMGKRSSSRIGRTLNKRRMTARAKADIEESMEEIDELQDDISELEEELTEKIEDITAKWEHAADTLGNDELAPRRADVNVHSVSIVWLPYWSISGDGNGLPGQNTVTAFERLS